MSLEVQQIPLEKEYEKHKNINSEDIKQLREWLKTQPHLPEEHITDLDLILNYHCCEASDLYTKEVLDLHYTLRTLFTTFFKDRVVDNTVVETMKTIMFSPLREHDVYGVRYIYCGIRRPEPKYFNLAETGRVFMMIIDLWQYEEGTWPGFSLVIDLKKATWGHITRLDLGALRQIIHFVQDGILLKMKNIIFINAPNFIDRLMMILKPLMKKELYSKFLVYDENADLSTTDIPVQAFPKDYGGNDLSAQEITDRMLERLKSNAQFFKKENLKRVNESLRPFKSPVVEDAIGIGSFKKLDLD